MCVPRLSPCRALLKGDYGFFRSINIWPPFVLIGIYSASLSASMSNLIGASRILHALAKDDLFGEADALPPSSQPPNCTSPFRKPIASFSTGLVLAPAKIVSKGGNPWGAVLYTWALVQVTSWPSRAFPGP